MGPMYHVSNMQPHGPPSRLCENEAKVAQNERQHETDYLSSMKVQQIHHCYELNEMPCTRNLSDFSHQGDLRKGRHVVSVFKRIWQVRELPRPLYDQTVY